MHVKIFSKTGNNYGSRIERTAKQDANARCTNNKTHLVSTWVVEVKISDLPKDSTYICKEMDQDGQRMCADL